jgi:hypothetical protein
MDPRFRQALTRQQEKVCKPFARVASMLRKGLGSVRVVLDERMAYFFPHLEVVGANRRTEPSHKARAFRTYLRQCLLDHPIREPSPTCMNRSYKGSGTIAQENWQTVRNEYGAHVARAAAERGIGAAGHAGRIIDGERMGTMHLL